MQRGEEARRSRAEQQRAPAKYLWELARQLERVASQEAVLLGEKRSAVRPARPQEVRRILSVLGLAVRCTEATQQKVATTHQPLGHQLVDRQIIVECQIKTNLVREKVPVC